MESITSPFAQQIVYLDFDGENTIYRNNDLNVSLDVNVGNSFMSDEQKLYILSQLNEMYDDTDVVFTLTRPTDKEYSTIYIGRTDAFNEYGSFAGLAETIDKGNQIKNDNAFVSADYTSDLDSVVSVIAHEVDHIVEGAEHLFNSDGIFNYAAVVQIVKPADLIISSFTTSTDAITSAQSVTLNFTVKNQGEKAAESSYVYIYDGDKYLDKVYIGNLNIGASLNSSYTIKSGTLSAGAHNLKVVADGSSEVSESNENNNASAIKTVTVANFADLIISSFTTSTDAITSEQSVTLNFTVKNQGEKAVSSSYVYIYDGNKYLDKVYIGNLNIGASLNSSYAIKSGTLSAGTHNLKVVADGSSVVPESNENNNASAIKTVTVANFADLIISSFTTSTDATTSAQSVTLNFTVKNQGEKAVSSSYVYIYDGDKYLDKVYIGNLNIGASLNSSYTIKSGTLSAGAHNLKVVADGSSEVPESNENNNYATRAVIVTSQDDLVHFKSGKLAKIALTDTSDDKRGSAKLSGHVGNGDAEDYFHVAGSAPALTTISISGLTCKAKVTIYDSNKKKLKTYSLKGNGNIYSGYLPGDYYVTVTSADKGKGKYNTDYSVNINATYAPGDTVKNDSFANAAASASKLQVTNQLSGWVGMGDIIDIYKFTNASGEKLSFTVSGVGAKLKLTVYDKNLKKVKGVSISKNGTYLRNLLVSGDFYVAIESADKGKKQHSNYNVSVNADIFPTESKANNTRGTAINLAKSGNGVVSAWDGENAQIEDWVGFGDKIDYFAFEMDQVGKIDIDLNLDNASLTPRKSVKVTLYNAAGKKIALDNLMTTKTDLAIGKYFAEVATSNEKKYSTGYNMEISLC